MSNPNDLRLQFFFQRKGFQIDTASIPLDQEQEKWKQQFLTDRYEALYRFGLEIRPEKLSPAGLYLYQLSSSFFRLLTKQSDIELLREKTTVGITDESFTELLASIPFAVGSEFINKRWIRDIFDQLKEIFQKEIQAYPGTVAMYLTEQSQNLRIPERVFFHLVESQESQFPFAFLATYATEERKGRIRHVPLEHALVEYRDNRKKLLSLLSCLNKAAEVSALISHFVESGEMFHPLRLTVDEAYTLLKDIPAIEDTGILCRVPDWWKKGMASVALSVSLGEDKPSFLGLDTMLSLKPQLTVDGMQITREEIERLLSQTNGLAMLKGKWVEVDRERLKQLLEQLDTESGEITLFDALRMGVKSGEGKQSADVGTLITNGAWLNQFLHRLRTPSLIRKKAEPKSFRAVLRPYQKNGFTWLNYMGEIGFGACLADDMGLGKTVQVLAFLERLRTTAKEKRALLIVPASLLGNWQREAEHFTPDMPVKILHGKSARVLTEECRDSSLFLTITTYGMAVRIEELQNIRWDCIILDEAQAIKNPLTSQTKAVKKLKGKMRIAMTGTPIENDLTNLWSLFDFLNKGLLGTSSEFRDFCKNLSDDPSGYARLKAVISPFMLRRLKSDKKIISDLPMKVEVNDYVSLSKKQIVLYRRLIKDLAERLEEADGMERRGLVLAYLTKFKQVCNHPDQYLGQQEYVLNDSGKFEMLRELCETIYEKRERVLVFTQFKEIIEPLQDFLTAIFHQKGYVLHGGTPVAKRGEIVESFQGDKYIPFIVLSVKAGGTGLNLTKANHVIHFDRWWNPAVENQATDRAYRIGQNKNVMVHKLVCSGTIEEKIDEMILSKKELSENVIGSSGESWITEMNNEELMSMLRLR